MSYKKLAIHTIIFVVVLHTSNVYAQSKDGFKRNQMFFHHLSTIIEQSEVFDSLDQVRLDSSIPSLLQRELRTRLLKSNILSESDDATLLKLDTISDNRAIALNGMVERHLRGELEILALDQNQQLIGQDIIPYSYVDSVQKNRLEDLNTNKFTTITSLEPSKRQQIWSSWIKPSIIILSAGITALLLYTVRG